MTSDERYGTTDRDDPSGVDRETGHDEGGEPDEAAAWDLEAEPAGRTLAPTADGPAAGVRYAELPLRAAAFALDAVLIVAATDYTFRSAYSLILSLIPFPSDPDTPLAQGAILLALLALVAAQAVAMTYLIRVFRATPGQMALGLFTLSRRHGRALTPYGAFVRWLLVFAPLPILAAGPLVISVVSQTLAFGGRPPPGWLAAATTLTQIAPVAWLLLLTVSVLVDEHGRGLHDHLSGSVVVRREGPPS